MNQLWGKQGQLTTGNSTVHNNFGQLLSLLKVTSPEQAKAQVEQLVKEKGVTSQELSMYQRKAEDLAKVLGIK